MTKCIFGAGLAVLLCGFGLAQDVPAPRASSSSTFVNPLLPSGPDPWIVSHDGYYYFMATTGDNLTIWKTRDVTDLRDAQKKVVWTPPPSGRYSKNIWAPELHFIGGKWYLYFAADDGSDVNHRIWVLENSCADPLEGDWTMKGELADAVDGWAIDPSVFENEGKLYVVWSGRDERAVQCIFIARLKNPWTIEGRAVELSAPQFPWEKARDPGDQPYDGVNEGPEILKHDGKIFLIYSAGGCWTDHYALGMLMAPAHANLLKRRSWKKDVNPVLTESPGAHAYGTGHNTFFVSPDGKQNWIVYHANPEPHQGCHDSRSPRAQPFTWNSDGTPNFGVPVPLGTPIPKPSGTPGY